MDSKTSPQKVTTMKGQQSTSKPVNKTGSDFGGSIADEQGMMD